MQYLKREIYKKKRISKFEKAKKSYHFMKQENDCCSFNFF